MAAIFLNVNLCQNRIVYGRFLDLYKWISTTYLSREPKLDIKQWLMIERRKINLPMLQKTPAKAYRKCGDFHPCADRKLRRTMEAPWAYIHVRSPSMSVSRSLTVIRNMICCFNLANAHLLCGSSVESGWINHQQSVLFNKIAEFFSIKFKSRFPFRGANSANSVRFLRSRKIIGPIIGMCITVLSTKWMVIE